jgi:hypothetical protein
MVETVGARDFAVEDGVASVSATSSSSSSESLRMMTLPSSTGPRSSRLRSLKSFFVNFSSHEVSGMRYSSSEEISTTRILSEGLPCSKTGEHRRWEETSDGDPGGDGDPDGVGDGVEILLGEEEPSLEGE